MEKYIIREIFFDGYERTAVIEKIQKGIELKVHFLEYDEYLESDEESKKRKIGDIIEGDLSIELVTISKKTKGENIHCQNILNSSHIEAVVEVVQIIDNYSVYAYSSIIDDKILIEFESPTNYMKGDKIFVCGSLEITELDT